MQKINALIAEYLADHEYEKKTSLCCIMNFYGSDKGNYIWHNYTSLYEKILKQWKEEAISIFEMGLGTNHIEIPSNMGKEGKPGASLYGWSAYFPKAKVYGADIDRRILFNTSKIRTFYCDQTQEEEIRHMFFHDSLKDVHFDLMIDDGLHEFHANWTLLLNSMHKLKMGGIYIIEDLTNTTRYEFTKKISYLRDLFSLSYINIIDIPLQSNNYDNSLLVIRK